MVTKTLKPKYAPVPVYDSHAVEQGVDAATFQYTALQEMMNTDVALVESSVTRMPKTVLYQSEHGSEEMGLAVRQDGEYGGLEVKMTTQMGQPDYLTACIPQSADLAYNQAYLDKTNQNFKADFIKTNHLGQILPKSKSPVKGYYVVVFDMDELQKYDPIGYDNYMTEMRSSGRLYNYNQGNSLTTDFVNGMIMGMRLAELQRHGSPNASRLVDMLQQRNESATQLSQMISDLREMERGLADIEREYAIWRQQNGMSNVSTPDVNDYLVMKSVAGTDFDTRSDMVLDDVDDLEALPSGEKQALPSGEKQALPSGEKQALPSGEKQALPSGEKQALPSGEKQALPSGEKRALPSVAYDMGLDKLDTPVLNSGRTLPSVSDGWGVQVGPTVEAGMDY